MRLSDLWVQNFDTSWTQAEREVAEIRQRVDESCKWTTETVPNQQIPLDGPVAEVCDWVDYQD